MNTETNFIITPSKMNIKTIDDLIDYMGDNLSFNQVIAIYTKLKSLMDKIVLQGGEKDE